MNTTKTPLIPAVHRIALYDHVRNLRLQLQNEAFAVLGNKCAICGSLENLRLTFIQFDNPLARKYQHSPSTLHRRICREPEIREAVRLLCRPCRLDRRSRLTPV
jgi:hypothetical protein